MVDTEEHKRLESVEEHLQEVQELLHKHRLVENLVHKQDMPRHDLVETLVHKQNLVELQRKLDALHPADVAYILEALPHGERLAVWDLVKAERGGDILLEVSDAVRETLLADMDTQEILAATEHLDTDEIADLAPDLPQDVVQDILDSLDAQNRARLQSVLSYPEESVGALMDFDLVSVREDITLEVALRYLRRFADLPSNTDCIFVVDGHDRLRGIMPLQRLLVNDPEVEVSTVMVRDVVSFEPESEAAEAAAAFDRYDLISAPVVNKEDKLLGRLTVDQVVDYIREQADEEVLKQAGLREEEDLFSSVWKSAHNRAPWLAINLVTAFVASRVIDVFQGSIKELVVLATLQAIVAGIGGNSGNQTLTLIVRGMALGQIQTANARLLILKELGVSALNGLIWGSVLGLLVAFWYSNSGHVNSLALGFVVMGAILLNLLVGAIVGILVPLTMHRLGRDPAVGSSVVLTFATDSMGFFLLLGLATLFLL
jgi:magnesium transporter